MSADPRSSPLARVDQSTGYITNIDLIREQEYPSLSNTTYLDHAGTTLYAKSLVEDYAAELTSNLFGNPHSVSISSQLSSERIDTTRLQVLRFFNADPDLFEVVFTANATAAVKLVADAFRDNDRGFFYGYHQESHTSLVGVRELAQAGSRCFDDGSFDAWISSTPPAASDQNVPFLFAFPGQSNLTGCRRPFNWCQALRLSSHNNVRPCYTLYDAAALVSSYPMDLGDADAAPDFTVLSFYKIFGFPDLGALIVRKTSGNALQKRQYFAGGTVDAVAVGATSWHAKKAILSASLEDGTLPFHNIIALQHAVRVHKQIYGTMHVVSRHTDYLTTTTVKELDHLKHWNGQPVCRVLNSPGTHEFSRGPTIACNFVDSAGRWVSNSEVEKLAIVKGIQFRTGGVCNPGGIASSLHISPAELRQNYAAGSRCGGPGDMVHGKPTGVIRISFGAMSSMLDVRNFIDFIAEFFVDKGSGVPEMPVHQDQDPTLEFQIESLTVFPIKSCAGFQIPSNVDWQVLPKGLAWDREWCLVHQGSNVALSQKRFPQMTMLQPSIDLQNRTLTITHQRHFSQDAKVVIDLDDYPVSEGIMDTCGQFKNQESIMCGEKILIHLYTDAKVSSFFSEALGVPCTLARYSSDGPNRYANVRKLASSPETSPERARASIKLSNESPILLVSSPSIKRLNEQISTKVGRTTPQTIGPESFRGNIVIGASGPAGLSTTPYIEDRFTSLRIRNLELDVLGPCQRCQMVCIDQRNGTRNQEPFTTLAKTRRKEGKIWFGMHLTVSERGNASGMPSFVRVGDSVEAFLQHDGL